MIGADVSEEFARPGDNASHVFVYVFTEKTQ